MAADSFSQIASEALINETMDDVHDDVHIFARPEATINLEMKDTEIDSMALKKSTDNEVIDVMAVEDVSENAQQEVSSNNPFQIIPISTLGTRTFYPQLANVNFGMLAHDVARSISAQPSPNLEPRSYFCPIRRRRALVRRDFFLEDQEESDAQIVDVHAMNGPSSSNDDSIPFAPEGSHDSDDPTEPSGSEHDYNDPENSYLTRQRSKSPSPVTSVDSDEESTNGGHLTNSSREGADELPPDNWGDEEWKHKNNEEIEAHLKARCEQRKKDFDDWQGKWVSKDGRWKVENEAEWQVNLARREYDEAAGIARDRLFVGEIREEADRFEDVVILELPTRCDDPGAFVITGEIDGTQFLNCLIDSGSACNVMSEVTYLRFTDTPLTAYNKLLRFGNQSPVHPIGVLNVVFVVEGYPVPTEFVIVKNMGEKEGISRIILGRPFLATTRAEQSFLSNELILNLPNARLTFGPEGNLTFRNPHNANVRWRDEPPRARTHAQPSLGGWRGRGRGRGRGF